MYQQRMKEAIDAIKKGEMIIIMDDEDRENEGDLVMAGIFSTPEKINFMAQEARGLICVSITQEIAKRLDLPPMVQKNDSNHETAFTISIDAKEAKTGISAFERDLTIRLMCDNNTKPSDFVRPGHIFPLIAKEGGTLVRTGHTEASVDICRLAGLAPISVICEIMKKDGTMAGRGDKFLLDFAKEHNLKILYVSDIIQYRLNFENLLREMGREAAEFMGVKCEKISFKDHLEREHIVFSFEGDSEEGVDFRVSESSKNPTQESNSKISSEKCGLQEKLQESYLEVNDRRNFSPLPHLSPKAELWQPLVRFHNASIDVSLLHNPLEWSAMTSSLQHLAQKGGYLICLNATHIELNAAKTCGDMKDFGIGAQILKRLGVKEFTLLSACGGNKGQYHALSGFDLVLVDKIEV